MSSDSSSEYRSPLAARILQATGLVMGSIGLFFVGQFAGVIILLSALHLLGYDQLWIEAALDSNVGLQFLAVLLVELVTAGLLWQLLRLAKLQPIVFLKLQRPKLARLAKTVLAGYVMYFACFLVLATLIANYVPAIDVDQSQQLGFGSPSGISLLFVFLSLVILPAIVEEILFRGVLFQGLRSRVGVPAAVIATSLLFGAAHLEFFGSNPLNWIAAVDTAVFSLFLIWVFIRAGNLWASIGLHALKNAIAFTLLFVL